MHRSFCIPAARSFSATAAGVAAIAALGLVALLPNPAAAQTILANTTSNNGGSPTWGIFMDFTTASTPVTITSLTTASTAAANANYTVTAYTRVGSGLSGPAGAVATGPGSSSAGWTLLGTVNATQGAIANDISLPIALPSINVGANSTVGLALVFNGVGPRYFGTGTAALQTFSNGTLTLTTGDVRSAPFTTTGSYFSSRGLTGSVTYSVTPAATPEPGSLALMGMGAGAPLMGVALRRRRKTTRK